MASEIAALETRGLTKVYPGFWSNQRVTALSDLNLLVKKGEIFGLLGPNGSGKTTTIKLLLGLINATSGTAEVLGQDRGRSGQPPHHRLSARRNLPLSLLERRQTLDFYARLFNMNHAQRKRQSIITSISSGWIPPCADAPHRNLFQGPGAPGRPGAGTPERPRPGHSR